MSKKLFALFLCLVIVTLAECKIPSDRTHEEYIPNYEVRQPDDERFTARSILEWQIKLLSHHHAVQIILNRMLHEFSSYFVNGTSNTTEMDRKMLHCITILKAEKFIYAVNRILNTNETLPSNISQSNHLVYLKQFEVCLRKFALKLAHYDQAIHSYPEDEHQMDSFSDVLVAFGEVIQSCQQIIFDINLQYNYSISLPNYEL